MEVRLWLKQAPSTRTKQQTTGSRRPRQQPTEPGDDSTAVSEALMLEKLLRSLIAKEEWEALGKELSGLSSASLASGRNAVYIVSETLRRKGDVSKLVPLLSKITPDQALACSEDDVMPLLSDIASNQPGQTRAMLELVQFLILRNVTLSAKSFSVLFKGFGRAGDEGGVDRVLQLALTSEQEQAAQIFSDVVLLNSLIDAYIRCGSGTKAEALFLAVAPSSSSFSSFSSSELGAGQGSGGSTASARAALKRVSEAGERFVACGVRPTIRTYNTIIKTWRPPLSSSSSSSSSSVSALTASRCDAFLADLRTAGVAPDSVTINTLVDAAARGGELLYAEGLLDLDFGESATTGQRQGQWQGQGQAASKGWGGARLAGVEGYTALIAALSASSSASASSRGSGSSGLGLDGVRRVLGKMRRRGLEPNQHTCGAVMNAFVAAGARGLALGREELRRATELFLLQTQTQTQPQPQPQAKAQWRAAATSAQAQPQAQGQESSSSSSSTLLQVSSMGRAPLAAMYDALIVGLCLGPGATKGPSWGEQRQQQLVAALLGDTDPDTDQAQAKSGAQARAQAQDVGADLEEARGLLVTMLELGLRPGVMALNAYLRALSSSSLSSSSLSASAAGSGGLEVLRVVRAMRSCGPHPDRFTHAVVFSTLGAAGECGADAALQYLLSLPASEAAALDTVALNALLGAVAAGPDPILAPRLLLFLSSQPQPQGQGQEQGQGQGQGQAVEPPSPKASAPSLYSGEFVADVVSYTVAFQALTKAISEPAAAPLRPSFGGFGADWDRQAEAEAGDSLLEVLSSLAPAPRSSLSPAPAPASASAPTLAQSLPLPPALQASWVQSAFSASASSSSGQGQGLGWQGPVSVDRLVDRLFRQMRFGPSSVEPDARLVASLRNLFRAAAEGRAGGALGWLGQQPGSASALLGEGLSPATARLVFEELLVSGWEPADLAPILDACRFSPKQVRAIEEGAYRVRSSAASSRLFNKYKWNSVESGFTAGFF